MSYDVWDYPVDYEPVYCPACEWTGRRHECLHEDEDLCPECEAPVESDVTYEGP